LKNKNYVICGRMYVIDTDACNFGTSVLVVEAQKSQDQEAQMRILQSVVLRAIGLEAMLMVPAGDFSVVLAEIIKILLEGNHAASN